MTEALIDTKTNEIKKKMRALTSQVRVANRDKRSIEYPPAIEDASRDQIFSWLAGLTKPKNAMSQEEFLLSESMATAIYHQAKANGVVRRHGLVHVSPSGSDEKVPVTKPPTVSHLPRRSEVVESESDLPLDLLLAKYAKHYTRTRLSTELYEDGVAVVDRIVNASSLAIAKEEDRNAFMGDGTQSFGYVWGYMNALDDSCYADASTGNTSAETLDVDDFANVIELLPELDATTPRWFMSRSLFAKSALRLGGSNSVSTITPDGADAMLLGYPVHFIPQLPDASSTAGSKVCWFGHLDQSSVLCQYGPIKVYERTDAPDTWELDQVIVNVSVTSDFIVWDRGLDGTAGAMVGLKLAES